MQPTYGCTTKRTGEKTIGGDILSVKENIGGVTFGGNNLLAGDDFGRRI